MSVAPVFASVAEAAEVVRAGLGYLAAADATAMAAETQAHCLRVLEQVNSIGTAARTAILAAFTSGQGYSADADYSPRAWLIHQTHVTRGAAVGYTAWVRRAAAHPEIAQALAAGEVSESVARTICGWTDKLPDNCREDADAILLGAAAGGADVADLAGLAGEIYARSLPPDNDNDKQEAFDERSVKLETTFGGAGVLAGDLTPECASILATVLDALSAPAGAEDTRSQPQRCHDALHEAMRRLVTAGLLPERAGQPVKAVVHISLADLMVLDGSSALLQEWTARVRAQWAGHRARASASASGGGGGAWLDGDAAEALACDAAMVPFVTGDVNPGALEDLVRLCVQLDRLRHHPRGSEDGSEDGGGGSEACPDSDGDGGTGGGGPDSAGCDPAATTRDTALAWEALERAIIGKAVDLLSGPGGLASFLRRRQLGARLGGPSLPLDIGFSQSIPAGIRNAVTLRDQHCQWAGGCHQPASACEVHHVRHKKNGGKTSVKDCVLLCWFHHQVVIHKWGWTLRPEPRRDHHRVEPRQNQDPAQPQPPVNPG